MTIPPLSPSEEKIKRAERKFGDLIAQVNDFMAGNPCSVTVQTNGNDAFVVAELRKQIPIDFSFEAVEIVGHLRSSLDKMMVALVAKNGRGTSGVGFPFGGLDNGKPNPFPDRRIEARIKKKLTFDQWALVAAHKPYPGGNDFLWSVNEVANTDKHSANLVELVAALQSRSASIGLAPGQSFASFQEMFLPANIRLSLTNQNSQTRFKIASGLVNAQIDYQAMPLVVFGEVAAIGGYEFLTTINQQISVTKNVIDDFRTAFF